MFLKATKRRKDGKVHLYWSLGENVRVGHRVFQRQALSLGELNDSQRAEWQHAVEAFDEKGNARQLKLFPEDRAPAGADGQVVRIRMDRLSVRNLRNWDEVWLGLELWYPIASFLEHVTMRACFWKPTSCTRTERPIFTGAWWRM